MPEPSGLPVPPRASFEPTLPADLPDGFALYLDPQAACIVGFLVGGIRSIEGRYDSSRPQHASGGN